MTAPHRTDAAVSSSDLRRSLLAAAPEAARVRHRSEAEDAAAAAASAPSSSELLEASPTLVRLCEGYHRSHASMLARSRRQRVGLALLVAATGVTAVLVNRSGTLTASTVSALVLGIAGSSCVALAALALLWTRDQRRLRGLQGLRMLRALQTSCSLPAERLETFRRGADPTTAFFDCYAAWREAHAPAGGGRFGRLAGRHRQEARA